MKVITGLLLICFFIISCSKNETRYFADNQNNSLPIFSNTGNNVFTCYINDSPWRTINRITPGLFSPATSELYIFKQVDSIMQNFLVMQWWGYFQNNALGEGTISFYMHVPPDFSNKDIASLQGKRISIDSTQGYFITSIYGLNSSEKGTGSIYFNRASFDSTAAGVYTGSLSGLLEANFSTFKITSGRFDHQLSPMQVQF